MNKAEPPGMSPAEAERGRRTDAILVHLVLGDRTGASFARPATSCRPGPRARAGDVEAAAAVLAEDDAAVDVIVVAQARPGEFSHAQIERLRQAAPLARIVGLLGSWCEGEMRSGRPWPAAVRTLLAPVVGPRRSRVAAAGRRPALGLGAAVDGDRRRSALGRRGRAAAGAAGLIAISSRSRDGRLAGGRLPALRLRDRLAAAAAAGPGARGGGGDVRRFECRGRECERDAAIGGRDGPGAADCAVGLSPHRGC